MTRDDNARAIIAEGQRLGVSVRGIQIALITALQESNLVMYANSKDPASLALPHDAVGVDGMSVGIFQQQNFPEWGPLESRMDATRSAGTFYDHMLHPTTYGLPDLNYDDPHLTPGQVAQNVQRSKFPDRYDAHWDEAVTLYNRLAGTTMTNRPDFNEYPKWSSNNRARGGTKVDLWLIHTQEGDGNADQLADFLRSTEGTDNERSYHYTISQAPDGGVTVIDVVDTDASAFAVGNSNDRSISLCFAGSKADWTRDQWMAQAKAIDVAAYLCVADCHKYGIDPKVIAPPYAAGPPGISDHRFCTNTLHDGNTHTDVGGPLGPPWTNFPWDVFAAAVATYAHPDAPVPVLTPAPLPAKPVDVEQEIWDQLRLRWNCLGGHTLVEAVAEVRDMVCHTNDRGKQGVS